MAFGIAPQHAEEEHVGQHTTQHVLNAAIHAAQELKLRLAHQGPHGFKAYSGISASSFGEELEVSLEGSVLRVKSVCIGEQMMDWGKNKRNVNEFLEAFRRSVQLAEDTLSVEAIHEPVSNEDQEVDRPFEQAGKRTNNFLSVFIPTEGYFVTPILIILNALVFIAMVVNGVHFMEPTNENLLLWGANFRPYTLNGEWWRLFTACFIHIGILHLLMNMYALMYIGMMMEGRLGTVKFLSAYILSGIIASTASLWWHDNTISAGASGAIFGMYGVFLAMLTTNLIEKSARQALLVSISIFVGYNLLNGLTGGIDNAAHIGGLVSGMIIGYCFYPALVKRSDRQFSFFTIAVLTLVVVASIAIFYKRLPGGGIIAFQERMNQFADLEKKALAIYSMPEGTPSEKLISEIRNNGIPAWQESIAVLKQADSLDISDKDHTRNKILIQYCSVRILSYKLIAKNMEPGAGDKYTTEIQKYNQYIEEIITKLEKKRY